MQLAGHLWGRALHEWSLLGTDVRKSYTQAVDALRLRLDPGSHTLAVQDFCHTSQGGDEILPEDWSAPSMAGKVC